MVHKKKLARKKIGYRSVEPKVNGTDFYSRRIRWAPSCAPSCTPSCAVFMWTWHHAFLCHVNLTSCFPLLPHGHTRCVSVITSENLQAMTTDLPALKSKSPTADTCPLWIYKPYGTRTPCSSEPAQSSSPPQTFCLLCPGPAKPICSSLLKYTSSSPLQHSVVGIAS